jgi:outer membrane immunogenic protein
MTATATLSAAKTAFGIKAPIRRLLLGGVSLMVLTGASFAADLAAVKAPPALASSWAGFYLGVHAGYGWQKDDYSALEFVNPVQGFINGIRGQGGLYGAHAGYNWQFGRAIAGLEVDFSGSGIKGSNAVDRTFTAGPLTVVDHIGNDDRVKYLGSARARLGWLPADNVLLYGTAGPAWERVDTSFTESLVRSNGTSFGILDRFPFDKFGWVTGLGTEVTLGSPNWIGRIEYLHYAMGKLQTGTLTTVTARPDQISTAGSQNIDVVRAGVSYRFGEPARLSAVPYAKAPSLAGVPTWAGFYIGAHGGFGWGDHPQSAPVVVAGSPRLQ